MREEDPYRSYTELFLESLWLLEPVPTEEALDIAKTGIDGLSDTDKLLILLGAALHILESALTKSFIEHFYKDVHSRTAN